MAEDQDRVWRLPAAVRGGDAELLKNPALPPSGRARLARIVARVPEVMVRVTGRTRGGAGHLKQHLDYITRNGRICAETQDGQRLAGREALRALHDDWLLANAAESRTGASRGAQSLSLVLSMPPGTPADAVEAAARRWAQGTLSATHDWLMARHDDTDHPHVHLTVRAVGRDGRRLAPGPADLQRWREGFAAELRRLGVEAEATPRQARGIVPKAPGCAAYRVAQRGAEPLASRAARLEAEREARAPGAAPVHDWSRDIQARQASIRRAYLGHAEALARGSADDRRLAADIRRFVADMPVPLTRRQALVVELRRVLEHHPGRGAPAATPPGPSPQVAVPVPRPETPEPAPEAPRPKGRG